MAPRVDSWDEEGRLHGDVLAEALPLAAAALAAWTAGGWLRQRVGAWARAVPDHINLIADQKLRAYLGNLFRALAEVVTSF